MKMWDESGSATASNARGEAPKVNPQLGEEPLRRSLPADDPRRKGSSFFLGAGPGTRGAATGDSFKSGLVATWARTGPSDKCREEPQWLVNGWSPGVDGYLGAPRTRDM